MAYIAVGAPFRSRFKNTTARARYQTAKPKAVNPYAMVKSKGASIVKYVGRGSSQVTMRLKRTRRKTVRLTYRVPQGIGSTFSSFSHGTKLMSRNIYNYWKTNQKFSISHTSSIKISNTNYGQQAIYEMIGLTNNDFNDDMTRIGITDSYARTSSSMIYGKVTDVITYTNVELTTTYLHIYEIVPRRDLMGTSNTMALTWSTGLNEETGGTTGTTIQQYPYEKPFRSKRFCLNYLVKKIIQIELAPGESHKHTSTYYINRVVHSQITSTYGYSKNFTNMRLHIASGTPINDSTNKTFVSTSTVSLDVVLNRQYAYGIDSRPRTQTFADNSLNTITAAKVITDTSAVADTNA